MNEPQPEHHDPVIGQSINNYRICAQIGEGGMGTVYVAEHPFMGRRAAVKVLRPHYAQDEWMVALFMNEARAANAIGHPNIIDIIDVGHLPDGRPYLMMELLEGETLAARLARVKRLSVADALDFIEQAASALAMAHDKGIVHRDLKPENLFLVPDLRMRLGERVKVLDFGTAKLRTDLTGGRRPPQTGSTDGSALALFGSPLYMAPEQCDERAANGIDHRADIYAAGALLYHALCGQPPFVSDHVPEILAMHLERPPTPPRQLDPEIPEPVEAAILRALAKRPDQRFGSMGELIAGLRADGARRRPVRGTELIPRAPVGTLPLATTSALVPYRGGPARARRRRRIALVTTAAAATVAASLALWGPPGRAGGWSAQVRQRAANTATRLVPLTVRRELGFAPREQPAGDPSPPAAAARGGGAPVLPIIVSLPPPEPAAAPGVPAKLRTAGTARRVARAETKPGYDRSVIDGEDLWGRRH